MTRFLRNVSPARRQQRPCRLLSQIQQLGKETQDWRAQAWLLERRHPEAFGKVLQQQVSGPGGGPIQAQQITRIVVQPPPPPRLVDGASTEYRDRLAAGVPAPGREPEGAGEPLPAPGTEAGEPLPAAGGPLPAPGGGAPDPGNPLDSSRNAGVTAVSRPPEPGREAPGPGTPPGPGSPPPPPTPPLPGTATAGGPGPGTPPDSGGTTPPPTVYVDGVPVPGDLILLHPYPDTGHDKVD